VPPSTGRNAVQVQIARIRKLPDEAATAAGESIMLEHRPAGYLLDIDPDQVDLHRFTRLTEQARGRAADALDAYASAGRRLVNELGVEPGS